MRKFALSLLVLAAVALLLPAGVFADTITTYTFNVNGCSSACTVPAGTVTVDDNGTTTTISTKLNDGFYIQTGSHQTFDFSVDNASLTAADISGLPTGFAFDGYAADSYANGPFKEFDDAITCATCTPDQKGIVLSSFSFTIADSNLPGGFEAATTQVNGKNIIFAADIFDKNTGNTGPVGATFTSTTTTPEPASLALFGTGLFSIAGVLRRKRAR